VPTNSHEASFPTMGLVRTEHERTEERRGGRRGERGEGRRREREGGGQKKRERGEGREEREGRGEGEREERGIKWRPGRVLESGLASLRFDRQRGSQCHQRAKCDLV
jgi:hypothetical protein